jgi:hypothetical protein
MGDISTVGWIVARIRQGQPRLPRKSPKRAGKVTQDIPMIMYPLG